MASRSSPIPAYPTGQIALGIFVAASALVLMGVQPILVGLFSDQLHLDLQENGWVLAIEQFGGAAGALLGYWAAARFRWTYSIALFCAAGALINIWSGVLGDYPELMVARFASGLTTTLAYTVALCFLAQTTKPDKIFGLLMVVQTAFFSIDAVLLPYLRAHFGYFAAITSSALWIGAACLGALGLPAHGRGTLASGDSKQATRNIRPKVGAAALIGAFLLQLSIFAVWGFLEKIGRNNGLSDEQIGWGIGIGVLGGIPGGVLPSLLGERFGRLPVIAAAVLTLMISYVALGQRLGFPSYVLWISILNVGWVLGLSYYMGLTVTHDPDGRYTRLISFSQILSAGLGPACSALVIRGDNLAPIFVVAFIAALSGYIGLLTVFARRDRPIFKSNLT